LRDLWTGCHVVHRTESAAKGSVRQAKEYLDIGFVVHAIKRPDRSIAHDQDQLSALHHGFDDLALKLAEERTPRNRGEATEATPAPDTSATELATGASRAVVLAVPH